MHNNCVRHYIIMTTARISQNCSFKLLYQHRCKFEGEEETHYRPDPLKLVIYMIASGQNYAFST